MFHTHEEAFIYTGASYFLQAHYAKSVCVYVCEVHYSSNRSMEASTFPRHVMRYI